MKRIGIIGAGPAGLTAAYQLAKQGVDVTIYEAGPSVGGMCKSLNLWGHTVDIGPHRFFSKDKRVNKLWLEVVENDYEMVDRLTRIFYNNRFFYYPLKPFNALWNLGPFKALHCVLSYWREQIAPRKSTENFEDWVSSRFGSQLFNIFFKTYSEKLWGISCQELDCDFAVQRIKKLSLLEAIKNAFIGGKRGEHKTLVDQFAYPTEGTGMVYERMAERIQELGGKILLRTPVKRVITENGKATSIETEGGQIAKFDHIVSSMPLSLLVSRLPDVPENIRAHAESLTFRNTILVYLKVEAENLFKDNWLYVHSPSLQFGRVTNFRNWLPSLSEGARGSVLALEYWCYDQDALWTTSDEQLVEMAKRELQDSGLSKGAKISAGQAYRIKRCYPVYEVGYRTKVEQIENYLRTIENLDPIGRYGAFKYNNQDHSILMGIMAAENILGQAKHDLWGVNTDYDDYQESTLITKTGLVSDRGEQDEAPVPWTTWKEGLQTGTYD